MSFASESIVAARQSRRQMPPHKPIAPRFVYNDGSNEKCTKTDVGKSSAARIHGVCNWQQQARLSLCHWVSRYTNRQGCDAPSKVERRTFCWIWDCAPSAFFNNHCHIVIDASALSPIIKVECPLSSLPLYYRATNGEKTCQKKTILAGINPSSEL